MSVTRREFLASAAGALSLALPVSRPLAASARAMAAMGAIGETDATHAGAWCALLDLGEHCGIRESLAGYEHALSSSGVSWLRVDAPSFPRCDALIVPAAVVIPPWSRAAIVDSLARGATVILESGAAFLDPAAPGFDAHRASLGDHLRIRVGEPVQLWPRPAGVTGVPYVEYGWPSPALVRDHSRAVPLAPDRGNGEIIARVDGVPVALRRRVGPGTLLFLGSPLGPALRAGDAEAKSWLSEVLGSRSV